MKDFNAFAKTMIEAIILMLATLGEEKTVEILDTVLNALNERLNE